MSTNTNIYVSSGRPRRQRHTAMYWLMIGWWLKPVQWSVGYGWLWGRTAPKF